MTALPRLKYGQVGTVLHTLKRFRMCANERHAKKKLLHVKTKLVKVLNVWMNGYAQKLIMLVKQADIYLYGLVVHFDFCIGENWVRLTDADLWLSAQFEVLTGDIHTDWNGRYWLLQPLHLGPAVTLWEKRSWWGWRLFSPSWRGVPLLPSNFLAHWPPLSLAASGRSLSMKPVVVLATAK